MQRIAGQAGVIHGIRERFCPPASPHITAMHAEPSQEGVLREAFDIAGIARTFEAMQEEDLALRRSVRLMLDDQNFRLRRRLVNTARSGKSRLVDLARPEIGGDRQ
jgi:hypothetical protein